jgi:WD40 repeat protein
MNLAESQQFSLSPDGKRLVFAGAGADGVMRLWLRTLDSLETRPLAGTDTDVVDLIPPMIWSPDSRYVAYDNRGQLKRLDVSGGAPQVICKPPGGMRLVAPGAVMGDPDRQRGGRHRAMSGDRRRSDGDYDAPRIARRKESSLSDFFPRCHHFLYLAVSRTQPEATAIYFDSTDGGMSLPPRQVGRRRTGDATAKSCCISLRTAR